MPDLESFRKSINRAMAVSTLLGWFGMILLLYIDWDELSKIPFTNSANFFSSIITNDRHPMVVTIPYEKCSTSI